MRAFITGIAGFVGGHLAAHLRACGDELLGTSLCGGGGNLAWDISEPVSDDLVRHLKAFAPQAIYHLAAVSKAQAAPPLRSVRQVRIPRRAARAD